MTATRAQPRKHLPWVASGPPREKVWALTGIARHHLAMLDHRLLADVATLWAHHLGIAKKEILQLSEVSKSTMYRGLRKTPSFIEKLRSDAQWQFDEADRPLALACNLCDNEFTAEYVTEKRFVEHTSTYPVMYRHWQTAHGWSPTKKNTPRPSSEHLTELRSRRLLSRAMLSQLGSGVQVETEEMRFRNHPNSRLVAEAEDMRIAYAEAFVDSGLQLDEVVAEITQRDNTQHKKRHDDLRRGMEQEVALSEILRHTSEESMQRELRDIAIHKAGQLQVATSAIAKMLGKADKTISQWRSRGQLANEENRPRARQVPEPPTSRTGRTDNRYRELTGTAHYEELPDGQLAVTCARCNLRLVWDSDMESWLDTQLDQHWGDKHEVAPAAVVGRRHWRPQQ